MRCTLKTLIMIAVAAITFGVVPRATQACVKPFPPGVGASLTRPNPLANNFKLTIFAGETYGGFSGTSCACVLGLPNELATRCPVTAVTFTGPNGTSPPLGSFSEPIDPDTVPSFTTFSGVNQTQFPFTAFVSALGTAAAAGISLEVTFDLTCDGLLGHRLEHFITNALKHSAVLCTGPLDPNGELETTDPSHIGCSIVSVDSKCQVGKKKCVATKTVGLLKCHAKAEKTGQPVDPTCLSTVRDKFDACVAKLEAKGPCLETGNGPALEAKVDAFVLDVIQELDPSFPAPGPISKCTVRKKKCVGQKAQGFLSCHAKAEKQRRVVDPVCLGKVETKFVSCFTKAEASGDCLTLGDTAAIEAKVDAFVNDAVCEIDPSTPDVCPTPTVCGDSVLNTLDEECDGVDDAACPGQCGSPAGPFPCLCLTIARGHVIEHANADLDDGWTGRGHDARVVEGGGYIVDLYDCDGPGGPDTTCTVGPSCSGAPHSPCSNDAQCGLLSQGICRKRRTSVGPHCNLNIQQVCASDGDCPGTGNFCVKQLHGPPLPLSAGGMSVCVVNVFSEDVVGTNDVAAGSSAVRLRQRAITYLGPTIDEPCPVCGGFCSDPPLGPRNLCSVDADCLAGPLRASPVPCITAPICSSGASGSQPCRPNFPYGGATSLFGTTSVDCLPDGTNISGPGLDILMNPLTTGAVSFQPTIACDAAGFGGKTCNGSSNEGVNCTTDPECPGGTCSNQCFCPTGGGVAEKPNDCAAACVGGGNNGNGCVADTDCPGGFCHPADCRENLSDPDAPNEGACTAGPISSVCSTHSFVTCTSTPDCGGANCPFCDPGETCVPSQRQCFVNSGIIRVGTSGTPDMVTVAAFCEAATSAPVINGIAGLPGPAAIKQPSTIVLTP